MIWFLIIFLLAFWDLSWFLRYIFIVKFSHIYRKTKNITDRTQLYGETTKFHISYKETSNRFFKYFLGICTISDVNISAHQITSRYLRELDFAKFYHYKLTDIFGRITEIKKHGGQAFQGASLILHHQNIKLFHIYKIESKIEWWDENSIYLEQKFLNFDDNLCLTVLSKQRITGVNVVNLMREFEGGDKQPKQPEKLILWIKSMELSSQKLRKVFD